MVLIITNGMQIALLPLVCIKKRRTCVNLRMICFRRFPFDHQPSLWVLIHVLKTHLLTESPRSLPSCSTKCKCNYQRYTASMIVKQVNAPRTLQVFNYIIFRNVAILLLGTLMLHHFESK